MSESTKIIYADGCANVFNLDGHKGKDIRTVSFLSNYSALPENAKICGT